MSQTVNYGIDLGTTNSSISRMTPKGPEIIPVRRLNYIPSAVAIDKRGDVKVGTDALNPHLECARLFKRMMGNQSLIPMGTGEPWSPEQLSAEVLKTLRTAARLKAGEDLEDVVITVPAMFTQPQCAATNQAARLAGLNAVSLLQEPIAAATAYLSESPADGTYLVYDLGGGTFDVSLVRLRAGEMNVLEHGGDNYLGGADFDRAVFDWTLREIARKGGDISTFSRSARRFQLMAACEEARITLSDTETAPIYLDEFDLPVAKIELSRLELESLVEPMVTRTIEIAKDRVQRTSPVRSVLLVGGPTQMPYIRMRLQMELGLSINFDQDPMTVVANGAAIHAGSILRPSRVGSPPAVGAARLELFYEPVSPESFATVAGRVMEPSGFDGDVRIASIQGDWETGWTKLRGGAFSMELSLCQRTVSEFRIELRDAQGRSIPCEPPSFSIQSGVRAATPVSPYNYGVVLEGGHKADWIVRSGAPLPISASWEYRLAKAVAAGSSESVRIYFVEGSSTVAEDNSKVGELVIRGTDVRRTLRENERVEVKIQLDESRKIRAIVHIPILNEDFEVAIDSFHEIPDVDDLKAALLETQTAITEIEEAVDERDQDLLIRAGRQIESAEASLERAERGEIGEAERAQKQLADAKGIIRPLRETYGIVVKHADTEDLIRQAVSLCHRFGDRMGLSKLEDLHAEAEEAFRLKQERTIQTVYDQALTIFWEHYGSTPECWVNQVELMKKRVSIALDQLTYSEHLYRAERCLSDGDYEGVRLHALRARQLLPDLERYKNRFYDAAIR